MFKKVDKFEQYTDPTGEFTNKELKFSEWYIKHRLFLRKSLVAFLSIWSVITLGYGLGYFFYYLIIGYSFDAKMYNQQTIEFVNYDNLKPMYKPLDIQVKSTRVFDSVNDKYDLVSQVFNPNERWLAYVTYKYKYAGGETTPRETFFLPGESRPLIYFGLESVNFPSQLQLVIDNIKWKNIDRHAVPDVKSFIMERSNFVVENFIFNRIDQSTKIFSNAVKFDISNLTAYNYLEPEFIVELIDGQTVGYMYFSEDKFLSGAIKKIDIRSQLLDLSVSDVKIYPIINLFDRAEYLSPGE
ncbi:MAG: hypothetical protein WA057_05040 [Candidatus Magasanikiibacteriota bacterium]